MTQMSKEAMKQKLQEERNTHFQGFAKLLIDELIDQGFAHPTSMHHDEKFYHTLVTQRAYDLIDHAFSETKAGYHYPEYVPDLTELPHKHM